MAPGYPMKLLVANVGTRYMPGVKDAIGRAVERCRETAPVDVVEQPNISMLPFFGLAWMRNRLCMRAYEGGYSHILLVENDVLIEQQDTIARMLAADRDILVPWFSFGYEEDCIVQEPVLKPGQGVQPITWAVVSCIMLRCGLRSVHPFDNMCIYLEEETHFQKWRLQGLLAFQHTDVLVTLLRKPTPLWEVDFTKVQTPGDVDPRKMKYAKRH